jgi:SAM-dependent MidA family methyltransferase
LSDRFIHPNPSLSGHIIQQIKQHPQHRITFAEFMNMALYHPQLGYYASNPQIGARGDFYTSPHLGSEFGELLAEQFAQMWQILERPDPFALVEIGAGQGLLADDVLNYLQHAHPDCFAVVDYQIIETATALIAEQRQRLQKWLTAGVRVNWRELSAFSSAIVGCVFSNELVDALPVHQVMIQSSKLQEVYVTLHNNGDDDADVTFVEVIDAPSTPQLAKYFDFIGIDLSAFNGPDGYRTEVNLAALDWLATIAVQLQRGYVLTIDYGYPAQRYYHPVRSQGTLQCYYRHSHHNNPYIHVGEQDITAHVDFTALERQGERCGLSKVGFTQQGLFLMALGLGDRLAALSQATAQTPQVVHQLLQRREALHRLIDPMGLGNFGVLIQAKGLTPTELSQGLQGLQQ